MTKCSQGCKRNAIGTYKLKSASKKQSAYYHSFNYEVFELCDMCYERYADLLVLIKKYSPEYPTKLEDIVSELKEW